MSMVSPGQSSLVVGFLLGLVHLAGLLFGVWLLDRVGRTTRSDRVLLMTALAASILMGAYIFVVSEPTLVFWDFRNGYWSGARAVLEDRECLRVQFDKGVFGFVNLPIIAYVFAPFALLPEVQASLVYFALSLLTVLLIWRLLSRLYDLDRRERAVALFALASFGPLHYSVRLGNTSHLVLAGLLAGMLLARERRDVPAGLILGGCIVVKPVIAFIGVAALMHRRLPILVAAGGVVVCAVGLSLAVFGWDMHVTWYEQTIQPFATAPIAAFNSQSLASFAGRIETGPAHYRDWIATHPLSAASQFAVWAITLAIMLLTGRALWVWRGDETFESGLLLVLVSTCIISVLSWAHYHVWLLPAIAFGLTQTRQSTAAWRIRVALMISFVLAAFPIYVGPHAENGAVRMLVANVVISNLLVASLICWVAMLRLHRMVASQAALGRPTR